MKKLFSLLMLFLAMFMFVACDKDKSENDGKSDDAKLEDILDVEVEDEKVNQEVEVTEASKNAVAEVLVELGVATSESSAQAVEAVVTYIEMARLSEEKVVAICELVKANKDLLTLVFGAVKSEPIPIAAAPEEGVTVDQVKALFNFVKELLNVIGDDTLGVFMYNFAKEQGTLIEGIELETYVVESRFMMRSLRDMLKSIDDAEVELLYNSVMSQTEMTAGVAAQLVDVAQGVVESINYGDQVWADYYDIVLENADKVLNSEEFNAMLEAILKEIDMNEMSAMFTIMIDSAKGLVEIVSDMTPATIQFAVNVLDEFDEATIAELMKEVTIEYDGYFDEEKFEWVENDKYIVDGKEVSEEEYEKASFAKTKVGVNAIYDAYKKLSDKDKDALVKSVEAYFAELDKITEKVFKEQMPGENLDNYKYKGETATLDEVFAALDKFLANEVFDEEDSMALAQAAAGYMATKAPIFAGLTFGE